MSPETSRATDQPAAPNQGRAGVLIPVAAGLFALLLFAHYLLQIDEFAINMPRADDFDMLIGTLLGVVDASSSWDVIRILLARHGEHYVAIPKAAFIFDYMIFGSIDFAALTVVGNVAVPAVATALLLLSAPDARRSILDWLPVPLILCTPAFSQASLWACAVLEHLWVMVFVVAALVLDLPSKNNLSERPSRIIVPVQLALCICALLCQGNGLFLSWILAVFNIWEKRPYRALPFAALGIFGIFMVLGGEPPGSAAAGPAFSAILLYPLVFLGSSVAHGVFAAAACGAALIGLNLYSAVRAKKHEDEVDPLSLPVRCADRVRECARPRPLRPRLSSHTIPLPLSGIDLRRIHLCCVARDPRARSNPHTPRDGSACCGNRVLDLQ